MGQTSLWRFLRSRDGALSLTVTVLGALALGLVPNILQDVPVLGSSVWGLSAVAVGAVLGVVLAARALHARPGVAILVHVPDGDGGSGATLLRQDAVRRHAACFVVNPRQLAGSAMRNEAAFVFRVTRARIEEHTLQGSAAPEVISLYVVARQPLPYELGAELARHQQQHVRLVALSEEPGTGTFVAVRLNSTLRTPPGEAVLRRLAGIIPETEGGSRLVPLTPADALPGRGVALILAVASNDSLVGVARQAAAEGVSDRYRFPRGDAAGRRCSAALVIELSGGNLPDRTEVHEAFVRWVCHQWRQACKAHGPGPRWLFTDAPTPLLVALGHQLGRETRLVPFTRSVSRR